MPKTSSADRSTYAVLDLVNTLRNPELEAPFATFGDDQLSSLHQLAGLFQTAASVRPMPTSPMPQVTIPLPRVPIISPQQEPARIHPRVLSPPVIHTISPKPVKPPRV